MPKSPYIIECLIDLVLNSSVFHEAVVVSYH